MTTWVLRTVSGLPSTFWYLWLGTLINRVGIFVLPFLTLFLTEERGFDIEQATLVISLYGIGSFFSQFAGGYLTDRIGRKQTMLISLLVTPLILLILSDIHGFVGIAMTMILLGFFTDLYRPASAALIADVVPPSERQRAFNLRFWAINLGAAFGLSAGGFLARQNYQFLFWGDAFTTFAFGMVILLFVPETKPTKHAVMPGTGLQSTYPSERSLLPFALFFTFLLLLVNSVYRQVDATLALAMKADGLTETDYGVVSALNGVVIVLLTLSINQFLRRFPHFWVLAGGELLIGLGFGLYTIASGIPMYSFGVLLWTLGEIASAPIAPTIMADLSPLHRRGFYQGVLGSGYGLAAFTGPIVGGLLYNRFGAEALWLACLFTCVFAVVMLLTVAQPIYKKLQSEAGITT